MYLQQFIGLKIIIHYRFEVEYVITGYTSILQEPIQLYIFSFLDCVTLLKAAQVCQTWNRLCTDNLLWKDKLESDMMKWNVIGHTFNPNSLRLISEPDYKQM